MCSSTKKCEPFTMSGEAAEKFDRYILYEYAEELEALGQVLEITDSGNKIIVGLPDDMDSVHNDNAHAILEAFGFV